MVPLFVGYALIVWFFAGRYRRRLLGWISVVAGVAGLALFAWLHYRLSVWTDGRIFLPVLQTIVYPYAFVVTLVAVFITAMPRPPAAGCAACGYDLDALPNAERCPECGVPTGSNAAPSPYRASGLPRENLRRSDHPNAARHVTPSPSTTIGTPTTSTHR